MSALEKNREAGFTLVELLVCVVVMGFIAVALGTALFVGLRTSGDTDTSLDQSNAELAVASYLTKDVQAASPSPSTNAVTVCGTPVRFAMNTWSKFSDPLLPADTTVGYALQSTTIVRVTCPVGSGAPTSTHSFVGAVSSMTASIPSTGSCKDQFEVAVTAAGSTRGGGTNAYSFSVCAHVRAG
jgi:prepilin-type N-terminal cleavage/methylation domain-containing protein